MAGTWGTREGLGDQGGLGREMEACSNIMHTGNRGIIWGLLLGDSRSSGKGLPGHKRDKSRGTSEAVSDNVVFSYPKKGPTSWWVAWLQCASIQNCLDFSDLRPQTECYSQQLGFRYLDLPSCQFKSRMINQWWTVFYHGSRGELSPFFWFYQLPGIYFQVWTVLNPPVKPGSRWFSCTSTSAMSSFNWLSAWGANMSMFFGSSSYRR